ncbi:MAG: DUF3306 domain-containing protein [Betaproteobacteria bacterium]|nr:DUF3306 domain-containing protein [Betaproteobacteria bacterium]MSQ88585.1 DUF3306 domain-containing protein [Betaproteobacteria bacterium]
MIEEKEAFLDRWSRRKLEQAEEQSAPPPASLDRTPADEPAAPLPPIEDLTPESDFVPFMNSKVDGETRRAALKKLFADAHFNVPDPFEAYSEDYTVSEAIPMAMLKTLNQAQRLLFDDPQKKLEATVAAAAPSEPPPTDGSLTVTPQAESLPEGSKDVVGKQDA